MADPWSLDAIVAEAEDLAYKEQAEAEAKAKAEREAKKKADELNARESKLRAKQEIEAKLQAEVDGVKDLEAKLYKLSEALADAAGQNRKDLKDRLKKMDSVVKKARGELSREARKMYTLQSESVDSTNLADMHDSAADAEADKLAAEEAKAKAAEAIAKKKKAEEDAAYAAIRKKQADDMARRKAQEQEEQEKLERLRAKYAGGANMLDDEDPDNPPKTADSEYTDAGDLVNEVLENAIRKQEDDEYDDDGGGGDMMDAMREYKDKQSQMEGAGKRYGHKLNPDEEEDEKEDNTVCGKCLTCQCCYCLKPYANKLRKSKWFDRSVLSLIILNCVFLAMYDPLLDDDKGINAICGLADTGFTILFLMEMLVKWVGIGLGPYYRDGWNYLDSGCVFIGLIGFVPGGALGNFSGLRSARALRPLRTLNSVPGIKNLVGTIFNATHLLRDVGMLISFLLFLFSIVGLSFFQGSLRSFCFSDATGTATRRTCAKDGHYSCDAGFSCLETKVNPDYGYTNFDNAGSAMLSIFVVMTQDGWTDIMYRLIDTSSPAVCIYFIFIIMFLVIIALNLTAAILASRFGLLRQDMEQAKAMEEAAKDKAKGGKKGADIDAAIANAKAKAEELAAASEEERPPFTCCSPLQMVTKSAYFQNFTAGMMFAYVVLLCCKVDGMSSDIEDMLALADKGFAAAFLLELIILLLAEPIFVYLSSPVNFLDAVVVVVCAVDAFVIQLLTNNVGVLRMFRLARICQASKTLRRFKRFWRVVGSVQHTLDSAMWWNLIFFLVIFIYSLLGLQLLGGKVNPEEDSAQTTSSDWDAVDQRASFDSFLHSFITVFVMVSGKWYYTAVMTANASSIFSIILWITLIAVGNFILINLLLAVLIDNIAANAERVERADEQERERAHKRANHAKYVHGMCKRLHELGIEGKYLGEYKDNTAALDVPLEGEEIVEVGNEAAEQANPEDKYALEAPGSIEEEEEVHEEEDARNIAMMAMSPLPGMVTEEDSETVLDMPEEEGGSEPKAGSGCGGGMHLQRHLCRHAGDGCASAGASGMGVGSGASPMSPAQRKKRRAKEKLMEEQEDSFWSFLPWVEKKEKRKNFRDEEEIKPEPKVEEVVKVELVFEEGNKSCGCNGVGGFGVDNCLRIKARELYTWKWFEWFIVFLIFANCITLALDAPSLDQQSDMVVILGYIDLFFNAVFIIEAALKVIANGFIFGEHAYLNDSWNKLDFLIILVSCLSLGLQDASLRSLRALRALRALRPLRLISRLKGLRVVFNTIIEAMPALGNVMVLASLVWILFAILGLHLFCGSFWKCNDGYLSKAQCTGSFKDPRTQATVPRVWGNADFNFDNFGVALYTMFVIATLDDWQVVMWQAVDSTNPGDAPVKDNNIGIAFFFIVFVVCGSFFATSLFVGEIVHTYSRISDSEGLMLTEDEKQWAVAVRDKMEIVREKQAAAAGKSGKVLEIEPEFLPPGHGKKKPSCGCVHKIRMTVYGGIMHPWFDNAMMTVILANMLVMAATFYKEPGWYETILRLANTVFSYIFIVEMFFKLIGLGFSQYVGDVWNKLDGSIVLISIAGMFGGMGSSVSLLRSLRVLRVLRLIKGVKGLRSLASTLYLSIPSLGNVGIMLLLILYIYAVLGLNLFFNVKHGQHINKDVNFETFFPAIITLVRAITFDGWRGLMTDLMVSEPDCDSSIEVDNCGSWMAVPFFFSFITLGNFLMINIFTAVILRNFADAAMDEGLAGEGFLSQSMFKMNQLDEYLGEFQRRYRVYRRRKEKPVWLYSSWDHSINPAYCPECGTIPCMVQQFDPVLEVMVSPHMPIPGASVAQNRSEAFKAGMDNDRDKDTLAKAANQLFDAEDVDGDALLDSDEFKAAYDKWEKEQNKIAV